ncbi:MAG: hypothetical protein ACP5N1_01135 [Candidatus Woesearchaeota archaeon]
MNKEGIEKEWYYDAMDLIHLEELSIDDLLSASRFCRSYGSVSLRSRKDFENRYTSASYYASLGLYYQNEILIRQNTEILNYLKLKENFKDK